MKHLKNFNENFNELCKFNEDINHHMNSIEDLSEYLQEIFDKYQIREFDGEFMPLSWTRYKRGELFYIMIEGVDMKTISNIAEDINNIKKNLDNRIGGNIRIEVGTLWIKIMVDENSNERFSFFKKKKKVDDHITEKDLERVYDIIDMFAAENNLRQNITWDEPTLKDIRFYTPYNSVDEAEMAHDNNTDINFRFYSNNLEFITIEDTFEHMDLEDKWPDGNRLMDKMMLLISRIRRICPNLKVRSTKGAMKFGIKITKS